MARNRLPNWMIVLSLVALAAFFAPEAEAAGYRLVAQMDEPFVVNGELQPAGEVVVKRIGTYSPATTLNEIRIDGQTIGYVLAQSEDRAPAAASELLFVRDGAGRLVLTGLNVSGDRSQEVMDFAGSTPDIHGIDVSRGPAQGLLVASR